MTTSTPVSPAIANALSSVQRSVSELASLATASVSAANPPALPTAFATFEAELESRRNSGSVTEKHLIAFMTGYLAAMAPGKAASPQEIANHQTGLFRLFNHLLDAAPLAEFRSAWQLLLAYFHEYKTGALGARYIHRDVKQWALGDNYFAQFRAILDLVMETAEPSTRVAAIRRYSFDQLANLGWSTSATNRLQTFYNK